jgi:flagellar biosynthesis/type III secretory pathway M-ring protein FliF/YscJ
MPQWDFSITSLLFPLAVVVIWIIVFALMLYISRRSEHDRDVEAMQEAQAGKPSDKASTEAGPPLTALPS